jgi:hypothetical protein
MFGNILSALLLLPLGLTVASTGSILWTLPPGLAGNRLSAILFQAILSLKTTCYQLLSICYI